MPGRLDCWKARAAPKSWLATMGASWSIPCWSVVMGGTRSGRCAGRGRPAGDEVSNGGTEGAEHEPRPIRIADAMQSPVRHEGVPDLFSNQEPAYKAYHDPS